MSTKARINQRIAERRIPDENLRNTHQKFEEQLVASQHPSGQTRHLEIGEQQ